LWEFQGKSQRVLDMSAIAQEVGASAGISIEWRRVLHTVFVSRALDELEERQLVPAGKVIYQFTARGHDVTQVLLGQALTEPGDGATVYYRSRPLVLALGLSLDDALASTMMRTGSVSEGRDLGTLFNLPGKDGPSVLPAGGGVGSQYTPAVGWAQAIRYRAKVLGEERLARSIAVAHGGDASTAANGFWAAINIATTQRLPILFYIEDNGYGISVRTDMQTPGGNIARNMRGFQNLRVWDGDGGDPFAAAALIRTAVATVRAGDGPALLRLAVPRLSGHSSQDTQSYRPSEEIAAARARDPCLRLRQQLVPSVMTEEAWEALEQSAREEVLAALERVDRRAEPSPAQATRHIFHEADSGSSSEPQLQELGRSSGGPRINMLSAIRRTLECELAENPRVLLFGEDIGRKGGVHAATLGLQEKFGTERVFDTSLSEEGIIGRAVGMALAGLLPVPEIQFRKYADSAVEQLHDCGTLRWRTANRFCAPMVVRMPGGFSRCGDPWHSQSNEVQFAHAVGWRLAMPSNAEDAVGLLRTALRGSDPTIFFEHRALLDNPWARRPYPGDEFIIPFGLAKCLRPGKELTVVTWGAMVERCETAAADSAVDVELLDLRTVVPWDRAAVVRSVLKTGRCLIVHEDTRTAGFGAEIAAVLAEDAFSALQAPIKRLAPPDVPSPHSPALLEAVLPNVSRIVQAIRELASL
jgi:2-oxoisovalerate dehydrogenase E1 component